MSKTAMLAVFLLGCLLYLTWVDSITAQEGGQNGELPSPKEMKEIAKAKFEATQAKPRALARAKLEVAQEAMRGELELMMTGHKGADLTTLSASRMLLDAERAVHPNQAGQFAALERHWAFTQLIEAIAHAQLEVGKTDLTRYIPTQYGRIEAAMWLTQLARTGKGKPFDLTATRGVLTQERTVFGNDPDMPPKDFAEARFELAKSSLRKLALVKLEVAQEGLRGELEMVITGKKTPDLNTLEAAQRWLESALEVRKEKASRLAILEKHWVLAKIIEGITRGQFEAGKTDSTRTAPIIFWAVEAEMRLIEESRLQSGKASDLGGKHAVMEGLDFWKVFSESDPLKKAKHFSKARFEVAGADLRKLARAKLAVAQTGYKEEEKLVLEGKKIVDLSTLDALRRWVQSERALCTSQAEHLAALERYWTHAFIIEQITKEQLDHAKTDITRYTPVTYLLLDATDQWNRARKERKKS
jgi:hypothetical protein